MKTKKKRSLELKSKDYEPTETELEERVHIPTTPEELARFVTRSLQDPKRTK